jgi:hypothetical protein
MHRGEQEFVLSSKGLNPVAPVAFVELEDKAFCAVVQLIESNGSSFALVLMAMSTETIMQLGAFVAKETIFPVVRCDSRLFPQMYLATVNAILVLTNFSWGRPLNF